MLILPGSPAFAHCTDNLTGTPSITSPGASFSAGANNADTTSVAVLTAIPHDVHYLVIGIGGISLATANGQALLDVRIDRAGGSSWDSNALIDDLICGFTTIPAAGTISIQQYYHFPLWIPAGSSLGVQARCAHTVAITTGKVVMFAFGCPKNPQMWWCGQKVESLGINAASSSGTDVTPANQALTTTNIAASTARYGAIQLGVNGSDANSAAQGYYWMIGAGGSVYGCSPTFHSSIGVNEVAARSGFSQPIWCDIPSGTTIQVQAICSGAPETHNVAIYGVY